MLYHYIFITTPRPFVKRKLSHKLRANTLTWNIDITVQI